MKNAILDSKLEPNDISLSSKPHSQFDNKVLPASTSTMLSSPTKIQPINIQLLKE